MNDIEKLKELYRNKTLSKKDKTYIEGLCTDYDVKLNKKCSSCYSDAILILAILPLVTQSQTKKIVTKKTISPTAVSTEPSITPNGGTRKPAIIRVIATIAKTIAMIRYLHFKR